MNRKTLALGLVASALLALGACSMQKGPATEAISTVEAALAEVKEDAARYLPDELQGVESSLASLKDNFAKGEYKAVLGAVPGITSSIDTLKTNVAAKVQESTAAAAEWGSYAADLPQMVQAIQSRVDTLSASRRLPRGIDAAAFDSAKAGLDWMKSEWSTATSAFEGGNAIDAVARAKAVKAKGEEVLQLLGMQTG